MKLITVDEMRAVEREADAAGWTYAQMMETAGGGLADVIQSFYGYADDLQVTALVGVGNNGGDALIALELLAAMGWRAQAYLLRAREGDDALVARFVAAGGEVMGYANDLNFDILDTWLSTSTVLVDGLLGTGIRLPLRADVAELLGHVRAVGDLPPVVAVDCPSGVDCDTGQAAVECLHAEVTVCMAAVKIGLLAFPAFDLVGDLQVVDIGLPAGLAGWEKLNCEVISETELRRVLLPRPLNSHKGTFGTAVIAAGSLNYTGAAKLAVMGALRIGAGLVTLAAPAPLHAALAGQMPEATWLLLPHQMGCISADAASVLTKGLGKASVLLVGPGFGLEECTADFVRRLLEGAPQKAARAAIGFAGVASSAESGSAAQVMPPMVVDADGLKLVARVADWAARLPAGAVLTPHPGEMSILTGLSREAIQGDRLGIARRYAQEWGHVVVLKGAFTVIAAPDGRVAVIPVATSALAHAGTGDVLAGMIAGLRAQGLSAYDAAFAGAWLHAQAALIAAGRVGHEASVLASDVADAIAEVLAWVWER